MTRSRRFEGKNIKTEGNNGKLGIKKNGRGSHNWGVEGDELMDVDVHSPTRSPSSPSKIQTIPNPYAAPRAAPASPTKTGGKRKNRK
nr:hypothetical protein HDU97_000503 [Phlyctochytrium planicorne]